MTVDGAKEGDTSAAEGGALAPLKSPTFRNIWSASLLSNFGTLIQGVGAAWEMTRLTDSPEMVALVQSAMMLPLMLVAVPAGAIADLFDRRKVALTGLSVSVVCAITLTALAAAGMTTPWMLLGFCALIGVGMALYAPAWQSSIAEQVEPKDLPAAVALGSVSYNIARSFGPAIGGAIVLAAGATAAFGVNAASYIPLFIAFWLWKRPVTPTNFARERFDRAIVSGARFVRHSPPARTVVVRAFIAGLAGASISALTPLIARDMLHGDASTYGLLLGAFGVGAVAGALNMSKLRALLSVERLVAACSGVTGAMTLIVSVSHSLILTSLALAIAGAAWMVIMAMLNVAVQLSTPRWVTARALAWYQSALTGGIAIGAWLWGVVTASWSLEAALALSGLALIAMPLIAFILPMPITQGGGLDAVPISSEPEVALAITSRSGPVAIEIDYRVAQDKLREFSDLMLELQSARHRNGAYDWSLARDIADPALWTERYHYPTWGDYLRQRSRFTEADFKLQRAVAPFRGDPSAPIRRRLERPAGGTDLGGDDPIAIFTP